MDHGGPENENTNVSPTLFGIEMNVDVMLQIGKAQSDNDSDIFCEPRLVLFIDFGVPENTAIKVGSARSKRSQARLHRKNGSRGAPYASSKRNIMSFLHGALQWNV
jgi:hypothetical protein